MKYKVCPKCIRELSRSNFYKDRSRKDGLCSWCKDCRKSYSKKYNQSQRGREASLRYYYRNRDKRLEIMAGYNARNREELKQKREELRLRVFKHLSDDMRCSCGTSDPRVLTIDHIYNDGNIERRKRYLYSLRLRILDTLKEEARKRYQVLCRNCNWLKHLETLEGE